MRYTTVLVVFTLQLLVWLPAASFADEFRNDGNELLGDCATEIAVSDSPQQAHSKRDTYRIGFCLGFIVGLMGANAYAIIPISVLTGRPYAEVPEDTCKALRMYCVQHDRLIKDVVNEAIRKHGGLKEKSRL